MYTDMFDHRFTQKQVLSIVGLKETFLNNCLRRDIITIDKSKKIRRNIMWTKFDICRLSIIGSLNRMNRGLVTTVAAADLWGENFKKIKTITEDERILIKASVVKNSMARQLVESNISVTASVEVSRQSIEFEIILLAIPDHRVFGKILEIGSESGIVTYCQVGSLIRDTLERCDACLFNQAA